MTELRVMEPGPPVGDREREHIATIARNVHRRHEAADDRAIRHGPSESTLVDPRRLTCPRLPACSSGSPRRQLDQGGSRRDPPEPDRLRMRRPQRRAASEIAAVTSPGLSARVADPGTRDRPELADRRRRGVAWAVAHQEAQEVTAATSTDQPTSAPTDDRPSATEPPTGHADHSAGDQRRPRSAGGDPSCAASSCHSCRSSGRSILDQPEARLPWPRPTTARRTCRTVFSPDPYSVGMTTGGQC